MSVSLSYTIVTPLGLNPKSNLSRPHWSRKDLSNVYRWDSLNSTDQPISMVYFKHKYYNQTFFQYYRYALGGCFVFNGHLSAICVVLGTQAPNRHDKTNKTGFCCSNLSLLPCLSRDQRMWPDSEQDYGPTQEPGGLARCPLVTFGQTETPGKIQERSPSPGKNHQWTSPGPNNGWATCGNIKGRHPGRE